MHNESDNLRERDSYYYSKTVTEHAINPRNVGDILQADGLATITSSCGDTMVIWLKVKDGRLEAVTFKTDGCAATIACGSIITEIARGRTIYEAMKINQESILKALEGLPEEKHHCALLVVDTLKAAIADFLALKRDPWKKAYRR